jgi:hypothetical protein
MEIKMRGLLQEVSHYFLPFPLSTRVVVPPWLPLPGTTPSLFLVLHFATLRPALGAARLPVRITIKDPAYQTQ